VGQKRPSNAALPDFRLAIQERTLLAVTHDVIRAHDAQLLLPQLDDEGVYNICIIITIYDKWCITNYIKFDFIYVHV
jgi:hypothetical protein